MSKESSSSKMVPELLTQVRKKKKMRKKDAGICFKYIREISRPFHLGQDVIGVMCRYGYWKKNPSTEFLDLDEGILRLSRTEIKGFNTQNPQNTSQGGENIQMAFKKNQLGTFVMIPKASRALGQEEQEELT